MAQTDQEDPPRKRGGAVRILILALLFLVFAGLAAAAGGYYFIQNKITSPGPLTADGAERVVMIPKGASVAKMGAQLAEAGAIEDPRFFRIAAKLLQTETSMKAGEYGIPSGASIKEIVELLVDGRSLLYPVTIPEGLTSEQILARLAVESMLTGDLPPDLAEGVLLPDTYHVHRGETRANFIKRMITARETTLNELWDSRQAGLPFETREEAMILASIVEKETGLPDERPEVASVFVNRLRRNMKLETDPTIIYGVCMKVPEKCVDGRLVDRNGNQRGIRQSELRMETGFNTYQIDGLPPTPICNPGREAIAAVLNPPQSDYIFFVADGSGGHAFAKTYSEHLRNVANWRRIEKQRSQ